MKHNDEGKVPLFRSWNGWYALVLIVLVVLVIVFALITQYFA